MIRPSKHAAPVVVVSKQRSGTTAFNQALGAGRHITACGEVFHHAVAKKLFTYRRFNFYKWRNALDPDRLHQFYFKDANVAFEKSQKRMARAFVRHLLSKSRARYALIDIKYDSWHHLHKAWQRIGDQPILMQVLSEFDVAYIHIVRQNQVRRALSTSVAGRTKRWHYGRSEKAGAVARSSIRVDPDDVYAKVDRTVREIRVFRQLLENTRCIELYYESMFGGEGLSANTIERVNGLLGADVVKSHQKPPLQKTPMRLGDVIKNREELMARFARTPYEYMAFEALYA